MRSALPLLFCLCVCASAWAASPLELRRADATHAHASLDALGQQQAAGKAELESLSVQIEALKAQRQRSAGTQLEADLRRSQALSDELAQRTKAISDAQVAAQAADQALLSAIDAELETDRKAWEGADRAGREQIITRMRGLRAERDSVRARTPSPAREGNAGAAAFASSEDPTALLEQADALRDAEDKVHRRLAELDARIVEAKREHELDRRMGELSGDESIFDEQDRSLRLTRSSSGALQVDRSGSQPFNDAAPAAGGPLSAGGPVTPGSTPPAPHAVDHEPQLAAPGAPAALGDDLGSLEKEHARLEQLAQSLEAKARAAEQRAHAGP